MTSKQRVFSHSNENNYNDYIKNKKGVEILKNIKNNRQFDGSNNGYNFMIKKFTNHTDLINYTKTYNNYANLEGNITLMYINHLNIIN